MLAQKDLPDLRRNLQSWSVMLNFMKKWTHAFLIGLFVMLLGYASVQGYQEYRFWHDADQFLTEHPEAMREALLKLQARGML